MNFGEGGFNLVYNIVLWQNKLGFIRRIKVIFFKYYDLGVFNYINKYFKYVCMINMYSFKYQKYGKDWWELLVIVV